MINAIIFDCVEIESYGRALTPYSEKVLNTLFPKYKLAMFSKTNFNGFSNNTDIRILQKNGINNYFEVIKIKKNLPAEKYLQCSNKLETKPEETLFIGNNFDELKTAYELGFQTCRIQNEKSTDEFQNEEIGQPIKKIKSVEELLSIL